jgi:hypothetical protein
MKLYTEEQIRNAMRADFILDEEIDNLINKLTPIELPSDEEIYIEAQSKKDNIKKLPFDSASFQFGAMWLKDKIQGGNK